MEHKIEKLENPDRLKELNPTQTLKQIGLRQNDNVCDIGAGTGVFSLPAAKLTQNTVYAVDINKDFLEILKNKAENENLKNIVTELVTSYHYSINDGSINVVLLVTVFHEIEEKEALFAEIKRILKVVGKVAVIEFFKKETPLGPPADHRISQEEVLNDFESHNFSLANKFDLGDNLYCFVFEIK